MTALASAQSVREFYRELWVSVHNAPASELLADDKPLPPFLCRSLAFGTPALPGDCSWVVAMTGSPDGVLHRIETGKKDFGLHWGVDGVSQQLHNYASIEGHSVVGFSASRKELLEEALALVADLGGAFLDTVCNFIGMVVWLKSDHERANKISLTSSSFPGLPHCVVVTDRAAMGVLPNERFSAFSAWALAESLYHESLHQVLSATILKDEIFVDTFYAATGPTIHVDWRNADWPLDRALHAMFVYANIFKMRQRLLDLDRFNGAERDTVMRVQAESGDAAMRLGAGLDRHRAVFTESGNRLLTELTEFV